MPPKSSGTKPLHKRLGTFVKDYGAIIALAGTILGVLTACVGLPKTALETIYMAHPELRPAEPVKTRGVEIKNVAFTDREQTLREFRQAPGPNPGKQAEDYAYCSALAAGGVRPAPRPAATPTPGLAAGDLSLIGNTIALTARVEGYQEKCVSLRWHVYDADKKARAEVPSTAETLQPFRYWRPTSLVDEARFNAWVPLPRKAGTYYIRLELYDEEGTQRASVESEVFKVVTPNP